MAFVRAAQSESASRRQSAPASSHERFPAVGRFVRPSMAGRPPETCAAPLSTPIQRRGVALREPVADARALLQGLVVAGRVYVTSECFHAYLTRNHGVRIRAASRRPLHVITSAGVSDVAAHKNATETRKSMLPFTIVRRL